MLREEDGNQKEDASSFSEIRELLSSSFSTQMFPPCSRMRGLGEKDTVSDVVDKNAVSDVVEK